MTTKNLTSDQKLDLLLEKVTTLGSEVSTLDSKVNSLDSNLKSLTKTVNRIDVNVKEIIQTLAVPFKNGHLIRRFSCSNFVLSFNTCSIEVVPLSRLNFFAQSVNGVNLLLKK